MQLADYLEIIRKRWWLIGVVALVAAVAALGISKIQRPVYRAQAKYIASINRYDSGSYAFAATALNNFIEMVHNRDEFEILSQQLKLDVPADRLLQDVRMQAQPSSLTITIEADSPNVDDPPRIINAVGAALIARIAENNRLAEGQDRFQIQRANPGATFKAKPQTKINTLAGGILGLILGTLFAFVLEYLDDTLKNATDVERFVGLTTLSQIPSGAAAPAPRRQRVPLMRTEP